MLKPVSAFKPTQVTTHLSVHEPSFESNAKLNSTSQHFTKLGGKQNNY